MDACVFDEAFTSLVPLARLLYISRIAHSPVYCPDFLRRAIELSEAFSRHPLQYTPVHRMKARTCLLQLPSVNPPSHVKVLAHTTCRISKSYPSQIAAIHSDDQGDLSHAQLRLPSAFSSIPDRLEALTHRGQIDKCNGTLQGQ